MRLFLREFADAMGGAIIREAAGIAGMKTNNYGGRGPIQRFFQKYAVQNLSLVIILCYGFGYLLQYINAPFLNYLTLNPYAICHGQIWRLVTWVLVPPDTSNILFIVIAMMFYYSIGTSLERVWGTYTYNVYIWLGIGITIIGAFVVMAVSYIMAGVAGVSLTGESASAYFAAIARYFSTYYVNMSIFLAYALTFPDAVVLLWFIIPVKVKWMGVLYGALLAWDFVSTAMRGGWYVCVAMAASLANFLIFWLRSGRMRRFSLKEVKRRADFRRAVQRGDRKSATWTNAEQGRNGAGTASAAGQNQTAKMRPQAGKARHRCAICGRTELDDPTLEFRYCSKCQGNYEFCQDHLFHHQHAVNGGGPLPAQENITIEPDRHD